MNRNKNCHANPHGNFCKKQRSGEENGKANLWSRIWTRAVHTGNDVDAETGAIKRPITMANSYELPYDPSDLNWSSAGKNLYTRNGGSNQQYLQEKLASLESGEDCMVLASGVAALSGLFFALLQSGAMLFFPVSLISPFIGC